MSTKKLLDNRIALYTSQTGEFPSKIQVGADIFNKLIDDCGQNFDALNLMATHYEGIPLEIIKKDNSLTARLIILG